MREIPQAAFECLTLGKITSDIAEILREGAGQVELEDGWRDVPADTPVQIVYRSYHASELPVGFQDHFRVLVALGGVKGIQNDVVEPGICFVRLIYNIRADLVTADFFSEL